MCREDVETIILVVGTLNRRGVAERTGRSSWVSRNPERWFAAKALSIPCGESVYEELISSASDVSPPPSLSLHTGGDSGGDITSVKKQHIQPLELPRQHPPDTVHSSQIYKIALDEPHAVHAVHIDIRSS